MRVDLLLRSRATGKYRSLPGRGANVSTKTSSVIPSACEISAPLRGLCAMKSLFDLGAANKNSQVPAETQEGFIAPTSSDGAEFLSPLGMTGGMRSNCVLRDSALEVGEMSQRGEVPDKAMSSVKSNLLKVRGFGGRRDRAHLAMFVQSQMYGSSNLKAFSGCLREAEW